MDTARQHWEILRQVPDELANRVREFMTIGLRAEGVLLATDSGEGFWLGTMDFGYLGIYGLKQATEPTRLNVPTLTCMAHGNDHILLLDKEGHIHTMGRNQYGQMALGTVDQQTYFTPQLISIPHKISSIRCGGDHCLALSEDGKVWAWGLNDFGQVGVPSFIANSFPFPRQIFKFDEDPVIAVECGYYHSLALTDHGEVYAWGRNDYGQLGDWSRISTSIPTRIPTSGPVRSMAAGLLHTLLLTQSGEVYVCGINEFCELALPTAIRYSSRLIRVADLPPITQIASHFFTGLNVAMSTEHKCFVWGHLRNEYTGYITTPTPRQMPPIYSTLDSVLSIYSTSGNTPYSVRIEGPRMSEEN